MNRTSLSRVGSADWDGAAGAADLAVFAGSSDALDLAREQEFAAFVASHRDRALRMAWRLLGGDGAAAEDVVQEAFARAHRNLARFREEAKLSTWFHRILVNEARRHQRWSWVRRRVAGEMPAEIRDERAAREGDPALRVRIGAAIARLPRGQREAFVLVHLEDLTLAEAAEASGRAIGTIKSHLHRACRTLRAELADLDPKLETNPA